MRSRTEIEYRLFSLRLNYLWTSMLVSISLSAFYHHNVIPLMFGKGMKYKPISVFTFGSTDTSIWDLVPLRLVSTSCYAVTSDCNQYWIDISTASAPSLRSASNWERTKARCDCLFLDVHQSLSLRNPLDFERELISNIMLTVINLEVMAQVIPNHSLSCEWRNAAIRTSCVPQPPA